MLKDKCFFIVIIVLAFLFRLHADSPCFELQASGGVGFQFFSAAYRSIYSPKIESAQTIDTISMQTLNLKAEKHLLLALNLNLILSSQSIIGMKISKLRSPINGKNNPVQINLNYFSRQPPSYEPREIKIKSEIDWPESSGKIDSLNFALLYFFCSGKAKNPEWRFYVGPVINSARISGGDICYYHYFLGGHSVLFSDQYKLKFTSDRFLSIGLNSGFQFLLPLSEKLSLFVQTDLQLFVRKNIELKILPSALVNDYPKNISSSEIDQITTMLNLEKLQFNGSYFALNAGLSCKL